MPSLTRTADVHVLHLGDTENRFGPQWPAQVHALLDQVVAGPGPRALVTAAGGRFWSNGLDLDAADPPDSAGFAAFAAEVEGVLGRMLALPVPTVAAIQGHAFAAGAMLALAHDVRLMRADRGFFCLPEIDIRIPFTTGMSALIRSRLPPQVAHEAMTTGRRYGGGDALAAGIVDATFAEADVLPAAIERAAGLGGRSGPVLGTIKRTMYAPVLAALGGGGAQS